MSDIITMTRCYKCKWYSVDPVMVRVNIDDSISKKVPYCRDCYQDYGNGDHL